MSDSFSSQRTTNQAPLSPRLALWTELERLRAALGRPAPTATLTIEQLEEEIARLKVEAEEPNSKAG